MGRATPVAGGHAKITVRNTYMSDLGRAVHWIDDQWLDQGETKDSYNPATGEVIGT
ncbi:MAG: hypothetical protein SPI12_06380 [Actinomycetaceae bacterium]|nr:hypothetical protein [Actinomycetaceae bacterium]MDY6083464.1 hypothetical protein [Actinomycetaceae bacterium]